MSLHQLARHIQSAGRGNDQVLVHMTPREVQGLQALALAHGGSLTINPKTGLVEAGFLETVLPMIAGFALGPAGFALMSPLQAALTVGALGTVATGSLGKGLMMGLGAFGGGSLGAGASATGAAAAPAAASSANAASLVAANQAAATQSALSNAASQAAAGGSAAFPGIAPVAQVSSPFSGMPSVLQASAAPSTASLTAPLTPNLVNAAANPALSAGNVGLKLPTSVADASSPLLSYRQPVASVINPQANALTNLGNLVKEPSFAAVKDYAVTHPYATAAMGYGAYKALTPDYKPPPQHPGYIRPYDLEVENLSGQPIGESTAEREQLRYKYRPLPIYRAGEEPMADGGLATLANGGTVEQMSRNNAIGGNTMYPLSQQQTPSYSNPQVQVPIPQNVISSAYDAPTNPYTGEVRMAEGGMFGGRGLRAILDAVRNAPSNVQYTYDPNTQQYTQIASDAGSPSGMKGLTALMARLRSAVQPETPPRYDYNPDTQQYTQLAGGGISNLGDYSDGGRLLKGPGDGVSDSIPASIGGRQPARLANNEFVIPARIVSEIGNGSTDAGAKKLYAMMDRVQKRRAKTIGKGKVAVDSKAHKEVDRL